MSCKAEDAEVVMNVTSVNNLRRRYGSIQPSLSLISEQMARNFNQKGVRTPRKIIYHVPIKLTRYQRSGSAMLLEMARKTTS
jgi:hypothetical protein